ncbi:extracellular solute-binding protein family 1 [Catenulispora acidiphila DSM 44928]|uniref:Extracellular solute-binding protein family 1 n=1 Tax=Catenulispora acidiphila (strain DSM 44928 / JCM 14897 / NBRC 102108 / NRRL B-24433 / ID139908) TaxID=479433 RepID=C7Q3N6_CATAD|nr:extracellular solute-binding protein [Catenulispora acidiphila]ACU75801.1 extracellular solute-binding protein family 1 [Catenulispora acidiphila DSM 44928]
MRSTKYAVCVALAAAVSLVLAGCGSSSSKAASGGGGKTLVVWDYEANDSASGIARAEAIKEFQAAHPGVTVKFEAKSFDQIQQNAGMILNSNDVPDVMEYNKGNSTAGLLSKQGLLTDLSSQAASRGWDKTLSPSLQTTAKYTGGIMGGSTWYGVPMNGEFLTVYYNKDLFAKYNVPVPTTPDQFTAAMATFKGAGVTPLAMSGADYLGVHLFYELALSKADRTWVNDYQLFKGKVDFQGPQMSYAANTFADWVKKGYISKDSAAVKAQDEANAFEQGKIPMMFSGNWWYGQFLSEVKGMQWGTFLFPGNTLQVGSSGNLWVVPTKAKNKDLAYDFIDTTLSKNVQNLMGNSGGVPVAADPAAITNPSSKELITEFDSITAKDGLGFYPDWPVTGYYDTLQHAIQELINGSKSPSSMLDTIGSAYKQNAPQ